MPLRLEVGPITCGPTGAVGPGTYGAKIAVSTTGNGTSPTPVWTWSSKSALVTFKPATEALVEMLVEGEACANETSPEMTDVPVIVSAGVLVLAVAERTLPMLAVVADGPWMVT